MNQRTIRRAITAGVLAAVLALPNPVHAASPGSGSANLWDWLSSLWEKGIAALWPLSAASDSSEVGSGEGGSASDGGTAQGEHAPGADPDGVDSGDQGPGADPNG
jgi:hypothetical protein